MSFDIKGKVILVTGANRGIGKAIAETLLKQGASKVYAAVRNPSSAAPLVQVYGDKVVPIELDMTKPESIQAAAKVASDVELVINNAGVLRTASALDGDAIDALKFEMDCNVYEFIHVAQAFAPVLKSNGGGALVQLNSVASLRCFPPFTTYCASKAASYSVTQALRELLRDQGTTVLSVHPGPIDTDMGDAAGLSEIAEPPELVAEAIVKSLKAGEFHCFPDSMAKQIGTAYAGFANEVIEGGVLQAG